VRRGRTPEEQTYAAIMADRDRLLVTLGTLQERNANLERQLQVWREGARPPDGKQKCAACKKVKLVSEFARDRSRLRGYRSYCKTCDKARYPDRRGSGGSHGKLVVDTNG
jgi:hypothetical protein